MKGICLVLVILTGLALGYAEERNWDYDVDIGLFLTQGAYGRRKPGNEVANIGLEGKLYGCTEIQMLDWLSLKGTIDCAFGGVHRQYHDQSGKLRWAHLDRSNNRADVECMLKLTVLPDIADPLFLYRVESRYLPNQDDEAELKNNFRQTVACGFSKKMLEQTDKELNMRLACTVRTHDQRVEYVETVIVWGSPFPILCYKSKKDSGLELAAEYKQAFAKINGKLRSQLRLYQVIEKQALPAWAREDNSLQPLEVNWETDFSFKVWKCFAANLRFALRHDIEEVNALQWKPMLGVGIGYIRP